MTPLNIWLGVQTVISTLQENNMGNEGGNSACAAARESREIDLGQAINQIDDVISHVENLLRRINGGATDLKSSNEPCDVAPKYNLAEIMGGGGTMIRDKSGRIHDLINEIEQTLF